MVHDVFVVVAVPNSRTDSYDEHFAIWVFLYSVRDPRLVDDAVQIFPRARHVLNLTGQSMIRKTTTIRSR